MLQSWINSIKPKKIEQLVGNETTFQRLFTALRERRCTVHVLLGPKSVGKRTSLFIYCAYDSSCQMMVRDTPHQINDFFSDENREVRAGELSACVVDDENSLTQDTRRRITDLEAKGSIALHRFQRIMPQQMMSFVMEIAGKLRGGRGSPVTLTTQLLDTICRHSDGQIIKATLCVKWLLHIPVVSQDSYPFEESIDRIATGTLATKDAIDLSRKHSSFVEELVEIAADTLPVPNSLEAMEKRNETMYQYSLTNDTEMLLLSLSQERANKRDSSSRKRQQIDPTTVVRPDVRQQRDRLLYGPRDSIMPLSFKRLEERAVCNMLSRMTKEWMTSNSNVRSLSKTNKMPFPSAADNTQLHGQLSFLDSMWLQRSDAADFYRDVLNPRSSAASFVFADPVEVPNLQNAQIVMLLHAKKSELLD